MKLGKLLERLFQLIPVLLGVSVIVFVMMALTPGDPVDIMLGDQQVTEEQEALLRHDIGLDLPAHEPFVTFPGNAAPGNFGLSYSPRQPLMACLASRLPYHAPLRLSPPLLPLALPTPTTLP